MPSSAQRPGASLQDPVFLLIRIPFHDYGVAWRTAERRAKWVSHRDMWITPHVARFRNFRKGLIGDQVSNNTGVVHRRSDIRSEWDVRLNHMGKGKPEDIIYNRARKAS